MIYFARLITIFLLFPLTLLALGKEVSVSDQIPKIPPEVESIITCGHWKQKNKEGFYRIISGEVMAQSFLYVQWIRVDQSNGERSVSHTLSFLEINNDHAEISLSNIQCQAVPRGIVLKMTAESVGHDILKKEIKIEIDNRFGKYEFTKQVLMI